MIEQPKSYVNIAGTKIWHLLSKGHLYYHRLDGPAIEFTSGVNWWFINNKRHRLDGPAIEGFTRLDSEWFINGKMLPTEEVESWLEENEVDLKTPEGQMAFKLRWT